jgi:MASE9 protein
LLPARADNRGTMQRISLNSKIYIAAVAVIGAAQLVNGLVHWKSSKPVELLALLIMTLIASRLKVKLPGINGTMSVNVPFLLIVAVRLNASEALVIAALASLAQSIPAAKGRIIFVQALFNSAAITNAVGAASFTFNLALHRGLVLPLSVAAAGAAFFLANTLQVALVLWLVEGKTPLAAWSDMARLSTPYYVLSAGIAAVVCTAVQFALWGEALALLPLMYSIYSSYRFYFATPAAAAELSAEAAPLGRASAPSPSAAIN